ncbi:MAG: hypothetical protein CVV18_02800 [Gammaproteobacteria bacterium HGW-Gammaproteobacteria-8]|nr:MAG: hypothetical protein CVV18_02800 [Gammaproteobacteria bacterium HGW-Gammaproteobacteria-8]
MRNELLGRSGQAAAAVLLVLAFVLIAVPGLSSRPFDKHEALVLQTATEMQTRDDWLVPYFNQQPRLNKPPLSYWATLGVARLRSGDPAAAITILDARMPSLLAALATVVLLVLLGSHLAGRTAGLLAGAIYTASPALGFFAQDARPDTLYAFLCFAAITSLLLAADCVAPMRRRLGLWVGWTLFGLAVLAKGPHIPLFLLIALLIALRLVPSTAPPDTVPLAPGWRATLRRVRPLAGLVLVLLISIPWWWAMRSRIDPAMLADSQLTGTLYQPALSGLRQAHRELLGPMLQLLPWSLIPLIQWRRSLNLLGRSPTLRRLAILGLVPSALLLLAPQHRWHYSLPMLPFLALLISMVVLDGLSSISTRAARRRRIALAATFGLVVMLLGANSSFGILWDRIRYDREHNLAVLVEPPYRSLPILATLSIESAYEIAVATSGRRVLQLAEAEAIADQLRAAGPGCVLLILPSAELDRTGVRQSMIELRRWSERGRELSVMLVAAAGDASDACPSPGSGS